MNTESIDNIKHLINQCLLPKLTNNYEETDHHPEISIRIQSLEHNLITLQKALASLDLNTEKAAPIIAYLLILYFELDANMAWNHNIICKKALKLIALNFTQSYSITFQSILYKEHVWNIQEVFNICLEELHKKLIYEDFKKYPGQIEVYRTIIRDLKNYPITIKPSQVLPLSLLLMDDYVDTNKKKGLECCLHILECLETESFEGGNYYEVIYRTLKKLMYDKEIEITKQTHSCLFELCRVYPCEEKGKKLDDLYYTSIEQTSIESNLYRKSQCLRFVCNLISLHKTNCINRSAIKVALCDCLDICTDDAVAEILLDSTLQCLKEWIKYCWCVWRFSKDYRMMSLLLKLLYTSKNQDILKSIQSIFETLYSLCSSCEQEQILSGIQHSFNTLPKDYCKRLKEININYKYFVNFIIKIHITHI